MEGKLPKESPKINERNFEINLPFLENNAFNSNKIELKQTGNGPNFNLEKKKEWKIKKNWLETQLLKFNINLTLNDEILSEMNLDDEKETLLNQLIKDLMTGNHVKRANCSSKRQECLKNHICLDISSENTIQDFTDARPGEKKNIRRGPGDNASGEEDLLSAGRENWRVCQICMERRKPYEFSFLKTCNHGFCEGCFSEYISFCIFNGKSMKIVCPQEGCTREQLTDREISLLVNEIMFQKYRKIKFSNIVRMNPDMKFCIRPGCEKILQKTGASEKLTCACKQEICFKCSGAWHEGLLCEQAIEKEYMNYLVKMKNIVKNCPRCKEKIEKFGGCNHMTCANCGYEFCWLCLREYSAYHFKWWNLTGCPAKLFYNTEQEMSCLQQVNMSITGLFSYLGTAIMAIFILFIIILLSVFAGIVFGLHLPFQIGKKYHKSKGNSTVCFCLPAVFAIILFPVWYFIGIFIAFSFVFHNFSLTKCKIRLYE